MPPTTCPGRGQQMLRELMETATDVEPDPYSRQIDLMEAGTFLARDYALEWLVQNILVAGQPAVLGGPKKGMKSSLIFDLAVSLVSGSPFLGQFRIPQPMRVAVLNGESGPATMQDSIRRICRAKRVQPDVLHEQLYLGNDVAQT